MIAAALFSTTFMEHAGAAEQPDSIAARMWRTLDTIPWEATFEEWSSDNPGASCDSTTSWWFCPEDCYAARCGEALTFYWVGDAIPSRRLEHSMVVETLADTAMVDGVYDALLRLGGVRMGSPRAPRDNEAQIVVDLGRRRETRTWDGDSIIVVAGAYRDGVALSRHTGALARALTAYDAVENDSIRRSSLRRRIDSELGAKLATHCDWLPAALDTARQRQGLRAVVVALLDSAATAPLADRDAYLLAADGLADRWAQTLPDTLWKTESETRIEHPVDTLVCEYDQLGSSWLYRHDLLHGLWRTGRTAAARDQALVLLLEMGFAIHCCEHDVDQFRDVIREGEAFLVSHERSARAFEVHFSLGQAYETWWSMSLAPPADEYVDPDRYKSGAEEARLQAIAHYRASVRLAPAGSYEAIEAAWRIPALVARHDTGQRNFWSFYD